MRQPLEPAALRRPRPLAEAAHRNAAAGAYGAALVARPGGVTAIGYSWIVGTTLSVVIEDDAAYRGGATSLRRVGIVAFGAFGAFVWALGYLAWRIRSRRLEGLAR